MTWDFWTWVQLYGVCALAWAAHRLMLWHHEPPVPRPVMMPPMAFTVAKVLAAGVTSILWPLILLADGVLWLYDKTHPADPGDDDDT